MSALADKRLNHDLRLRAPEDGPFTGGCRGEANPSIEGKRDSASDGLHERAVERDLCNGEPPEEERTKRGSDLNAGDSVLDQ